MAFVEKGSFVWVRLDPARGAEVPKTRPCIVVSRNRGKRYFLDHNYRSPFVGERTSDGPLVQPLLTVKETRLPKDSRALCDQVRTIDKGRVEETVGVLGRELMGKIDRGLILHLELEDYVEV